MIKVEREREGGGGGGGGGEGIRKKVKEEREGKGYQRGRQRRDENGREEKRGDYFLPHTARQVGSVCPVSSGS